MVRPRARANRGRALGVALLACILAIQARPPCRAQEPQAGLGLLDAVEMALDHDPNIGLVRTDLASARGALLSAAGQFDPLVTAEASRAESELPGAESPEHRLAILTSFGISQQLRSGLSLEPSIELDRSGDGGAPADQATVSFTLRQPLLQGRGRAVVTAGETSAAEEVAASRLDLQHTVSLRLAAVISQYWRAVAAAHDLEILRTTEESSRDLLETTRRLIAGGVTPAAELVQIQADVAATEANRIAGEQSLFAARQALGREIGLDAPALAALPLPSAEFPSLEPRATPEREEAPRFVRIGLARRADFGAAKSRLEELGTLLGVARDALHPRLDLIVTPSYAGRVPGSDAEDFVSPIFRGVPGLSTVVGLSFSWPTLNRLAEGDLIRAEAAVDRASLTRDAIAKQIEADVPTAVDAVGKAALQVEQAAEARRLFEQAVENERKKLQAGSSTLIDLITQRDRLTAARQRWVQARLALALALVELRFETGTLVTSDESGGTLRTEDPTALPSFESP